MSISKTTNTQVKFQITVAKDSMSVSIIIKKPLANESPATFDEIMSAIDDEGIVFGINEEIIHTILKDNIYNNPTKIADGEKPKRGNNSVFKFHFDTARDYKPQVDDDGHIDYKNINFIQNVEEGGVLVTRIPAQSGIPGTNVFGKKIQGPDGRNLPFKNGANTEISEDGNTLTAKCSGAIVFLYNKVSVNDVMLIKGDVDFNVGNLDCRGSVRVNGTVKTGFSIKTDGDLEVNSNVQDANLDVKGNIMVKGGFFGKGDGVMKAGGEIYVKFAEGQKIIAGGDVIIGGEAINCHIESQGNIIVKGPKGKIVGGVAKAKKEIRASYLGSESGTFTELVVAYNAELMKNYHDCIQEQARLTADGERIKEVLVGLVRLKLDNKLPADKVEVMNKLKEFNTDLPENLKKLDEEIETIKIELKKLDDAQIVAEKIVYPGVKASFGLVYREFNTEGQKCVVRQENGQIYISEYVGK